MHKNGISQKELAIQFDVSRGTISNIINNNRFDINAEDKISDKRKDMFGKNNPMYGKNHTSETRKLMSQNRGDSKGENNGRALLTKEMVEDIRNDTRPERKIAKIYGVARSTINSIKRGINWRKNDE